MKMMNNSLENKKIILGITGSISAFKAPLIVRELIRKGAEVKVVMTPSACEFITALTLSNLTKNPVIVDMFDKNMQTKGAWHIELSHWCDAMLIAPCSATTIARIAYGMCDNALATIAIALPSDKPLIIAPAMDSTMFGSKQVQSNLALLANFGYIIIPPEEGELSSGLFGPGRLPETNVILDYLINALFNNKKSILNNSVNNEKSKANQQNNSDIIIEVKSKKKDNEIKAEDIERAVEKSVFTLQDAIDKDKWSAELEFSNLKRQILNINDTYKFSDKKILITAGPTVEKIDDVRYISNFSSGKMGFALAKIARALNAKVTLITGPVALLTPEGVERIDVQSAEEMFEAAAKQFENSDIAILSAAVADFTPSEKYSGKIKKSEVGEKMSLELKNTKDILAHLSKIKNDNQVVVGFALESKDEIENGWKKLKEKGCDIIVVNSATKSQSGFQGDYNTITILSRDGKQISFPPMTKEQCSIEILNSIANYINNLKILTNNKL